MASQLEKTKIKLSPAHTYKHIHLRLLLLGIPPLATVLGNVSRALILIPLHVPSLIRVWVLLPIDAQPRVGGARTESCHLRCVSKYLRQTLKEPPSWLISPSPPYMSAPFICPPTDSNLSTNLPCFAPNFSISLFNMPPQLSHWHVAVPSWYTAAEVRAVPVCLRVYNVSVQHRDKRMFDANLSRHH